ncbi:MAG: hypothetical protein HPY57_15890 [Ignavibacteria bacterium]|nr:hypothetical protein [Ignavibacteria bacterium]
MKYLKTYNEVSSYLNLHGDDDYEITQVKRDKNHHYARVDGVLYELSGRKDIIVDIDSVHYTEGNMFYSDQIERYKEYIENGGILQTFPVEEISKCDNLDEMLSYLDDEKEGFDIVWHLFKDKNQKMYDLYFERGGYWKITCEPELYGFSEEYLPVGKNPLKSIRTIEDLENIYHNYEDEEPIESDYDNKDEYEIAYNEWKDKMKVYDEDILDGMREIIKYFEDEKEYHLTDFNHRFAALKELGKKLVYVEVL